MLRARDQAELEEWAATGVVTLPELSPRGKRSRGWQEQLDSFARLEPGASVALLVGNGDVLLGGSVTGEVIAYSGADDTGGLRCTMEIEGEIARTEFPYPALLQDPRSFFEVLGPFASSTSSRT